MKGTCTSIVLVAFGVISQWAAAQTTVIMSGLDNPRGLAIGPDGGIYVAEAGRGGNGTEIVNSEGATVKFGASGAVSRWLNGTQQRVITELPSLAAQAAPTPGGRATGLTDLAFSGSDLFGVIGLGADPAKRATLAADSSSFAHLVRLPLGAAPINVADLGSFEAASNPDAGLVDTNPYGLHTAATGFEVADAGANALLSVTTAGVITTHSVFPARLNPLNVGPPMFQAVPTTVATGPDSALYVGQLTGFPFPPGEANVYRIDPITGVPAVAASGFTNIIDIAFGPEGDMFVLQISANGLAAAGGPGTGKLIFIDADSGMRATLLEDPLLFPGGLLVATDGSVYVSNLGVSAGGGQVLRVVPEPGMCGVIGAALAVQALSRRRARRSRLVTNY
jgi:hypothetical protein